MVYYCIILFIFLITYMNKVERVHASTINVLPNKLPPEILKPQKEPDAKKKRVLCNPKEPCQFMQVKRVPGRNILYDITIPTWCQCAQQDVCTYRIFDFGRRIKIFHCLNVDEKSNNTS